MSLDGSSLHREGSRRSSQNVAGASQTPSQTGDAIPIDHNINHYELPNLTQLLYDFTNKEQDTILRCFRTGNYNSLRDLPANLLPNSVIKMLRDRQDENLAWKPPAARVEKLTGGGLFKDYEYMPQGYDIFLKQKQDTRREEKRKQEAISKGRPFVLGTNNYTWKYHDCFLPEDQQKDFVLPYFVSDDPYEASEEEMSRAKWLSESKILCGDFRPAQAAKSLERLTPQQLPDIVNYVKKVIMIDWAEVNFIIGTNPDSFIEIKFDQKSVDTENGLKAYMNTLIKSHDVISQFNLRRVIKFWGYKLGGHVYFMLAPSWIKFDPKLTFSSNLIQQLDEANLLEEKQTEKDTMGQQSVDSSVQGTSAKRDLSAANAGPGPYENVSESAQNMFKIHQMVFKKSSFIKEPTLYSKDIEV